MKFIIVLFMSALFSGSINAAQPKNSLYLEGTQDFALILAHGRGHSPDWKVVEPLRRDVNEQMNWHTLSLQMPAEDKNWREYADDFPQAYQTIQAAIVFLKDEKKVKNIYLMGHSMGSRMVSAFMAENAKAPIKGLIIVGCRNNGGYPLSCSETIEEVKIKVLDIWGGDNEKDINAASVRESLVSDTYQQVSIDGANHKFDDYESEFTSAVMKWLKK